MCQISKPRKRLLPKLLGCLIVLLLFLPYRIVIIHGDSMTPTYTSRQVAVATRFVNNIKRGDIVAIEHEDEILVKRVAYIGGDEVYYFFNDWGSIEVLLTGEDLYNALENNVKVYRQNVPKQTIYVLGDNPNNSTDSRDFGPVKVSKIIAKML
jgi:signal peptidase I